MSETMDRMVVEVTVNAAREEGKKQGWNEAIEAAAKVAEAIRSGWGGGELSARQIAKAIRKLKRK